PSAGQAGSGSPLASTCRAKMFTLGPRRSCQTTIAPPAPSVAIAGCCCAPGATTTARPQAGQPASAGRGTTSKPKAATANPALDPATLKVSMMGRGLLIRGLVGPSLPSPGGHGKTGAKCLPRSRSGDARLRSRVQLRGHPQPALVLLRNAHCVQSP